MKRNLLLLVAIFIAGSMSAQLYVGANVGYGFGAQKNDLGFTQTDNSKETIWASMGQGIPMGLKVGYFFNDNLGIEMGMNYWIGTEQTAADVQNVTTGLPAGYAYSNLTTVQSSQMRILPQLVYKTDMGLYGRFGMVLPVGGSTVVTSIETTVTPIGTLNDVTETDHSGKFSVGFVGAFGYAYELSDNMNLFGEMEYVSLSIKGSSTEITKYTSNDVDLLPSMTTYDKETNAVDILDASSNNGAYNTNPDVTKPKDELGGSTIYSSFRFNVGITMTF